MRRPAVVLHGCLVSWVAGGLDPRCSLGGWWPGGCPRCLVSWRLLLGAWWLLLGAWWVSSVPGVLEAAPRCLVGVLGAWWVSWWPGWLVPGGCSSVPGGCPRCLVGVLVAWVAGGLVGVLGAWVLPGWLLLGAWCPRSSVLPGCLGAPWVAAPRCLVSSILGAPWVAGGLVGVLGAWWVSSVPGAWCPGWLLLGAWCPGGLGGWCPGGLVGVLGAWVLPGCLVAWCLVLPGG